MKRLMVTIIVVGLSLAICGCKGGGGASGKQPSSAAKATADPNQPVVAKFNENVQPIFDKKCAHPSCHGAAKSAGMQLSSGMAYDEIVNVKSSEVPHFMRIKPNEPDSSYLVMKIEGKQAVGAQMPLTGGPLKTEDIKTIISWVEAGAKKD
jgi:hypothetical protein